MPQDEYRHRRSRLLTRCLIQRQSGETPWRLKLAQDSLAALRRMRVLP